MKYLIALISLAIFVSCNKTSKVDNPCEKLQLERLSFYIFKDNYDDNFKIISYLEINKNDTCFLIKKSLKDGRISIFKPHISKYLIEQMNILRLVNLDSIPYIEPDAYLVCSHMFNCLSANQLNHKEMRFYFHANKLVPDGLRELTDSLREIAFNDTSEILTTTRNFEQRFISLNESIKKDKNKFINEIPVVTDMSVRLIKPVPVPEINFKAE